MKIELKAIQHNSKLSQETYCFSAVVYIDGVRAGAANNAGTGGANSYDPPALWARLEEYAKTLPAIKSHGMTLKVDADMLILDLVTDWLLEKDLRSMLAKRIGFTQNTCEELQFTKALKPAQLADLLRDEAGLRKSLKDVKEILNLMPFDQALKIWMKEVERQKNQMNAEAEASAAARSRGSPRP